MLKVDLHTHTFHSYDCFTSYSLYCRACQRKALSCVAVTDHNEIEGAFLLKEMAPFKVIVGEEIKTREGEVIGLFLKEKVPPALSLEETLKAIKEQGGLVYLPHPFHPKNKAQNHHLLSLLEKVLPDIDVIEVFNARVLDLEINREALDFAVRYGLPMAASSDAHTPFELGNAYIEMKDFGTPEEFLKNLREGEIRGTLTPLWLRLLTNHLVRKSLRKFFYR